MNENGLNIAVVGATGAVGREMVSILYERQFPCKNLKLLASEKSEGAEIEFGEDLLKVELLKPESFNNIDIALFSAGGVISAEYAPLAKKAGAVVIDNSSHYRMHDDVPLVVPEVNSAILYEHLSQIKGKGTIIANPNCSTIQLVVALKPIADVFGLKRVVVSTYQSVSGAGKKGMDELWEQTLAIFQQTDIKREKFAYQIAFNCIPQCDVFLDNGYTKEEMKVVNETRKILGLPDLKVTATAVRVPVFSCHSEAVNVETIKHCNVDQVREILTASPGIIVLDEPEKAEYPNAVELAGTDAVYIGRIRQDESLDAGINMWVVADNLRKGAALNAVQIAELTLKHQMAN